METAHPPVRVIPVPNKVPTAHGNLDVRELYLGGTPRGAAVLLCESGDLDGGAAEVMNGFAAHGYESVAADLSTRAADGDAVLAEDIDALLDRLAERSWSHDQIGLLGYGLGARTALLAAGRWRLGASIAVCPEGLTSAASAGLPAIAETQIGSLTALLIVVAGDELDRSWPQIREFGARLFAASPAFTQIVRYPGVPRDFTRGAGHGATRAAAFDSWQRTLESFNGHVVPRPTPLATAWAERQRVPGNGTRPINEERIS